jgi:hypothetical protein
MRAEKVRVEADRCNPARDEPSILSGGHAAVVITTATEQKFPRLLTSGFDVIVDSLSRLLRQLKPDHPSIAISTDISRIAGLSGSARRTTTKFDRSRPVDSHNDETLGLAGPKLAACLEIKAHFCRRRPPLSPISRSCRRGRRPEPAISDRISWNICRGRHHRVRSILRAGGSRIRTLSPAFDTHRHG